MFAGAIHADYKNEAILGYAYDFNPTWRVQVDWQSGSENSSTIGFTCITRDFQYSRALRQQRTKHDLFGYVVSLTRFICGETKRKRRGSYCKSGERCHGRKMIPWKTRNRGEVESVPVCSLFRRRNNELKFSCASWWAVIRSQRRRV